MLKTGSKAWSLGLNNVMQQINNLLHESLPSEIMPNIIIFNQKCKVETQDPPRLRRIIMLISEDVINYICSANGPDVNVPDINAFKIALESDIQEISIGADESGNHQGFHQINPNADLQPAHIQESPKLPESPKSSLLSITSSIPSSTPSSPPPAALLRNKERVVKLTSDEEETEDQEQEAEDPEDPEEKAEEAEEVHPNARVPVNVSNPTPLCM